MRFFFCLGTKVCNVDVCEPHDDYGFQVSCDNFTMDVGNLLDGCGELILLCNSGSLSQGRDARTLFKEKLLVSLLNGRLENCKIGGCKEIRQPFANPSPTLCQLFANLSPTLCKPFLPTPLQPPLSMDPRHPFRDTG